MNETARLFLVAAALSGALAVGLGAFAAHGLKTKLPTEQLTVFDTGVRYQFYHTLALLVVVMLLIRFESTLLPWAGWAFLGGIVLFSGSLYLLATRELIGLTYWQWLGPVTPVGGVALITGWVGLLLGSLQIAKKVV